MGKAMGHVLNLCVTEIGHLCQHWTGTTVRGLEGEGLVAYDEKISFVSKNCGKKNPTCNQQYLCGEYS